MSSSSRRRLAEWVSDWPIVVVVHVAPSAVDGEAIRSLLSPRLFFSFRHAVERPYYLANQHLNGIGCRRLSTITKAFDVIITTKAAQWIPFFSFLFFLCSTSRVEGRRRRVLFFSAVLLLFPFLPCCCLARLLIITPTAGGKLR